MASGFLQVLKRREPEWQVLPWDGATKTARSTPRSPATSSTTSHDDVNELIADKPMIHTVIVLKNMFYAAKTLDDSHIGFMWDR